jgi:hypothetical protein
MDLPQRVEIFEEGPREGFQIEPGPISTADKARLIETLADTGSLRRCRDRIVVRIRRDRRRMKLRKPPLS